MMTVAIVGVMLFEKNNQIAILIGLIINVFSVSIVAVFSPVENINKLLNAEDKKKYKKISIKLVTLLIGVWVLFVGYSTKIALSISVSLLMVTITIVVEKLIKWKIVSNEL